MPVKKTSKEEILVKSAQLFREKGYFNTSISDLAKACGVHNANFYYYFTDKENLMEETLKYIHNLFLTKVIKIAYDETKSYKDRGEKMALYLEKYFFDKKGGCLMGNTAMETSLSDPKFLHIIKTFFIDWSDALTHLYKSKYNSEEARYRAEQSIQDFQGGIMLSKLYSDKKYFLSALKRAQEHVI